MDKKIIIVGAGIGGLYAAELLCKQGFKVEVFEKKSPNELAYDWHDDVSPKVFKELNIEVDPAMFFKKPDWSFATPFEEAILDVPIDSENADISIERRKFSEMLYFRAKENVKFHFNSNVNSPIIKENRVQGVMVDGRAEYADFVIDSAGVYSVVRSKLMGSFGISAEPDKQEVFYAYRAFFNRVKNTSETSTKSKVYLKHLGEQGISWCVSSGNQDQINVLVGRIGELSKETLSNALSDLRQKNASLGKEVLRGGITVPIPVRHPLTIMVADGYAAIGDAAFMTIPMLGSGIASSLYAAAILSDTVKNGDFSKENLWNYQIECYKKFGAIHFGIDIIKRWLLASSTETVTWLLSSGIISKKEMQTVSEGKTLKLSFFDILKKIIIGYKKLPLLISLNKTISRSEKATKLALSLPQKYNRLYIDRWQRKLEKLY